MAFSLFTTTCDSFAFLSSKVFSVPGHITPQNYVEFETTQVNIRPVFSFVFWFENVFSKLSLAKYHNLLKKSCVQ